MSVVHAIAVATALLATTASTLSVYPHQLAYFNELVGGPENGHQHLLHSNLDWGQDLLYLREWLRKQNHGHKVFYYFDGIFTPTMLVPPVGNAQLTGSSHPIITTATLVISANYLLVCNDRNPYCSNIDHSQALDIVCSNTLNETQGCSGLPGYSLRLFPAGSH